MSPRCSASCCSSRSLFLKLMIGRFRLTAQLPSPCEGITIGLAPTIQVFRLPCIVVGQFMALIFIIGGSLLKWLPSFAIVRSRMNHCFPLSHFVGLTLKWVECIGHCEMYLAGFDHCRTLKNVEATTETM
jgi:hypothetical protein